MIANLSLNSYNEGKGSIKMEINSALLTKIRFFIKTKFVQDREITRFIEP